MSSSSTATASLPTPPWFNSSRCRILSEDKTVDLAALKDCTGDKKKNTKCIVYWMQRDVRSVDNWALLYANYLARQCEGRLHVVTTLPPIQYASYKCSSSEEQENAVYKITERHFDFYYNGLKQVEEQLQEKQIGMSIVSCNIDKFLKDLENVEVPIVVTDFSPLRAAVEQTHEFVNNNQSRCVLQVDAHNIVPCWVASPKQEVGARTLRPKINKLLPDFLTVYPSPEDFEIGNNNDDHPTTTISSKHHLSSEKDIRQLFQIDETIKPVHHWARAGTKAAMEQFDKFINNGLQYFAEKRNDPTLTGVLSNLSPWVNHGHVSFQRLAFDVKALKKHPNSTASYLEEGIIRRELSDNFCYYNQNYDSIEAAANWVKETLNAHRDDKREYVYSREEFINGQTHDDLWNAAQMQLVSEGKMHGFLRMYWAKKILEWTNSPEEALELAQYLNDWYAIDGNDPNGFVGVGWSIMGVHDQGWKEREVFGKVRFMNYVGCKRKFVISDFVNRYPQAAENALKAGGVSSLDNKNPKRKKKTGTTTAGTRKKLHEAQQSSY